MRLVSPNAPEMAVPFSVRGENANGASHYSAHMLETVPKPSRVDGIYPGSFSPCYWLPFSKWQVIAQDVKHICLYLALLLPKELGS